MKYYFQNSEFKFVTGMQLYCPGDRISDVVVGVAKVDNPLTWDYPAYRLSTPGEWVSITFDRPDNWSRFELQIASDNGSPISGSLTFLQPLDESEIRNLLIKKKIVFLGAARNCAARVSHSITRIVELAELFKDYKIKIFENDSADQTLNICQSAADLNHNITIFSEPGLDRLLPQRTQRLAYARNKLLDDSIINEHDSDYICWIDMDGLVDSRFSTSGFLSNFKFESVWDAVFPISSPSYYDIWALRHKVLAPDDIAYRLSHFVPSIILKKDLHAAVQQLAPGALLGWLTVESAFGGMGLYKFSAARTGRYVGRINDEEICEHVPYHGGLIKSGAFLYVNPECVTHNP